MRLLRAFIAHEALTQFRSMRFRLTAVVYVVVSLLPSMAQDFVARRNGWVIGGAAFASALDLIQPFATTFFVGALAIDALTRERDENSFAVISLAPLSSAGYVLRRWIAIMAIAMPVTFLPPLVASALAAHVERAVPDLTPIAWTWLLRVAPVLVVISALMLALGAITGRTILAVIAVFVCITFGLGTLNDILAHVHRNLASPGDLFGFDSRALDQIYYALRGYWEPSYTSDAGYPLVTALDRFVPSVMMTAGLAALFLGLAPAFLRRTRRDLRPWRIREDHPLRTYLRTLNRVRDEYALDAGQQRSDRWMMFAGAALSVAALASLLHRETRFMHLAAERFAAETRREPREMSADLIPRSLRVEGTIGRDVHTRATLVLENSGVKPQRHLAFALHPGMTLRSVRASKGTLHVMRVWERIGIDVDPALAPRETRTLIFDIGGRPDSIEFALQGGTASFHDQYARYRKAKDSVELSDLSRSRIVPAATNDRIVADASAFVPVPRYSPWSLQDRFDVETTSFAPESVLPETELAIRVRLPRGVTAADSCGTIGRELLDSRCRFAIAAYRVAGTRSRPLQVSGDATLLVLERHEALARLHAPSLAAAMVLVERAWPGLRPSRPPVFFERPTKDVQRRHYYYGSFALRDVDTSGALQLLPERVFIARKPLDTRPLATALLASGLEGRRRIVSREQIFFVDLYRELARTRLSGEPRTATVSAIIRPATGPLLTEADDDRLRAVMADLEYRVGSQRIVDGVNDFLRMPGAGDGKQLLDAIARRAGVSLDNVYRDYFIGHALPKLTLANVASHRAGGGWTVTGNLRNVGTGEVFCPLVLRTSAGAIRQIVRVDGGETIPFALTTESAPRTLQLDPDRVCYRQPAIGLVDSVELETQP